MEMVHFIPPSQRRLALMAAQADSAPVLIHGASGTGKGAIARWIHSNGPRAAKPLHVAHQDAPLITQLADAQGGTLVIPEISEWPLAEQKALLGYFKTKSIPHPDGGQMPLLINVRVIAGTSHALDSRAQGGLFNMELLEKLSVFRIEMPSLAKRADEFEDIVLGITGEIARELHKEHLRSVSDEAWQKLKSYDWPGNLRELRNVLKVAVASSHGSCLESSELPEFGYDRIDFRATREQFEKIYLLELLRTFNFQIDKTSQMARMDKGTLLSKISQYGIQLDQSIS